jgi:hypothetical protein
MKEQEGRLRITLVAPPAEVLFALQSGRSELHQATRSTGASISFDFTVRFRPAGSTAVNVLGPYAQGTPASRFVYVNSGTYAGEKGSRWSRRAKIPLAGITRQLIEELHDTPDSILEARIAGTGRDGGPASASVPLLDSGWRVVRSSR